MKVAIAGAGLAGSYLYNLLVKRGFKVDLYEIPIHTKCGIAPCAWGTAPEFEEHAKKADLDPKDYILTRMKKVFFGDQDVKADLLIIDKPKFLKDLTEDAVFTSGWILAGKGYEYIFDATGAARAYLPPCHNHENTNPDLVLPCVQFRCYIPKRDPTTILIRLGKMGYSWSFPLTNGEFHVGAGSLLENPLEMLKGSGLLDGAPKQSTCACKASVRVSSPYYSQPFIADSHIDGCPVWGVGESIGTVSPLVGEGIAPTLRCVHYLLATFPEGERYTQRVLREFKWMFRERRIIDKLIKGDSFTFRDWRAVMNNSKRMGIYLTYGEALNILKQQYRKGMAE